MGFSGVSTNATKAATITFIGYFDMKLRPSY
jgi:uncharacterized membrane protein YtjA (UPF0391 family)